MGEGQDEGGPIDFKSNATNLRKNQTLAEQRLWSKLRNRQFFGYKFRRQMVMSGYIVDFIRHDPKNHHRTRRRSTCRAGGI